MLQPCHSQWTFQTGVEAYSSMTALSIVSPHTHLSKRSPCQKSRHGLLFAARTDGSLVCCALSKREVSIPIIRSCAFHISCFIRRTSLADCHEDRSLSFLSFSPLPCRCLVEGWHLMQRYRSTTMGYPLVALRGTPGHGETMLPRKPLSLSPGVKASWWALC